MKKIIGLILIMLMLSGCNVVYDLDNFVMPDDTEFMEVVKELNTPEKIGNYMLANFEYDSKQRNVLLSPYELWKVKRGVCGDFATFGMFVADYHGYEAYFVMIYFENTNDSHAIAIYKENEGYNYSSNQKYFSLYAENINEIIEHYDIYDWRYSVKKYEVKS